MSLLNCSLLGLWD